MSQVEVLELMSSILSAVSVVQSKSVLASSFCSLQLLIRFIHVQPGPGIESSLLSTRRVHSRALDDLRFGERRVAQLCRTLGC